MPPGAAGPSPCKSGKSTPGPRLEETREQLIEAAPPQDRCVGVAAGPLGAVSNRSAGYTERTGASRCFADRGTRPGYSSRAGHG